MSAMPVSPPSSRFSRLARKRLVPVLLLGATAAACSSTPAPTTFDLTAPRGPARGGSVKGQIVVQEPAAIQTFEAERIVVRDSAGSVSLLGGGQFADRLPRLIQARLIQTFENASLLKAVSRPGDRVTADYQLNSEIRSFEVSAATGEAVVEISVKLIEDRSGRILNAKVFTARAPIGTVDAVNAAQGLNRALSIVLLDIVRWIGTVR